MVDGDGVVPGKIMECQNENYEISHSDDEATRGKKSGNNTIEGHQNHDIQLKQNISYNHNLSPRKSHNTGETRLFNDNATNPTRINKATLPLQFPMINFLSRNIRGIGSKGSLERLQTLKLQHQFPLICLQELMVDSGKIENYQKKNLGWTMFLTIAPTKFGYYGQVML